MRFVIGHCITNTKTNHLKMAMKDPPFSEKKTWKLLDDAVACVCAFEVENVILKDNDSNRKRNARRRVAVNYFQRANIGKSR